MGRALVMSSGRPGGAPGLVDYSRTCRVETEGASEEVQGARGQSEERRGRDGGWGGRSWAGGFRCGSSSPSSEPRPVRAIAAVTHNVTIIVDQFINKCRPRPPRWSRERPCWRNACRVPRPLARLSFGRARYMPPRSLRTYAPLAEKIRGPLHLSGVSNHDLPLASSWSSACPPSAAMGAPAPSTPSRAR